MKSGVLSLRKFGVALARCVIERCLARRRNHCLDTDGGILAARTSSNSQCKSSG